MLFVSGSLRVVDEDTFPSAGGTFGARIVEVALDLGLGAGLT